jgi:D-alanyl-D-alanine carboxypeptidase/D-alanyl-D-alanine-endopeptidase (penicillin-binding protein 4)
VNQGRERRAAPLGVLIGLAAVPAVALAGVWQYADAEVPPPTTTTTTTAPPPPAATMITPLLSYRRHPAPLAEESAEAATAEAQAAQAAVLLEQVPDGSCVRVVDGDTVIAEEGDGLGLIPASNQKVFVAAVALDVLGPDFRFVTELQGPAPVNGVVPGSVYLVGGGDPVLRTADVPDPLRYPAFNTTALEPLADQLVAQGITTIEGDVIGDGSRYDDEFRVDAWGDAITSIDAGPYDALLVNDGLISPGNYGLDPSRSAARIYFDLLAARGITINGAAANAPRPADAGLATLATIESLPLTDVLVEMLHTSDNNTAELIVKEIGFAASGQGTRQAGLDAIRARLDGWGVPLTGVDLRDGSGLDRANRATCEALTTVLQSSPVADELRGVLPVAGRDGTLAEVLLGTPAEGRMKAKTGTLTDVKALSGSQPGADGRPLEFALVLNGTDVDEATVYQPIWSSLVEMIDRYPVIVEPDVEQFAPR